MIAQGKITLKISTNLSTPIKHIQRPESVISYQPTIAGSIENWAPQSGWASQGEWAPTYSSPPSEYNLDPTGTWSQDSIRPYQDGKQGIRPDDSISLVDLPPDVPHAQQYTSATHNSPHANGASAPSTGNDPSHSARSTTSQNALLAWNRKFAAHQVRLERGEPEIFSPGRRLGGGGIGVVHEVQLDGISFALKRTYAQHLTDYDLNEIKILGQITEQRHEHIVELIGSYIHRQRGVYELGLLIWPVAHCDLAVFLQDIELLGNWIEQHPKTRTEDLDSAVEILAAMTRFRQSWTSNGVLEHNASRLFEISLGIFRSNLGCIANVVAWLHSQGIRHKDMKPSQILLSPEGLWLTDFGWSRDISELTQSATDGGYITTLKYQAPERAQKQLCSRSEDIFALGCIFVEMYYQLARSILRPEERLTPWKKKGWYFQENLDEVADLMGPLKRSLDGFGYACDLTELISGMLAIKSDDRPHIDQVMRTLSHGGFFGECCASDFANVSSILIFRKTRHRQMPTKFLR
ncbi:kinase-like protein [Clathrospora elynae]|uniref:Kinase-like protein n=1 Tax=Clathrospora elynae TaxID=706981 RepID=A0A6A5S4Z0_9PLEO|nr:kinase-like protein [Clathrospora elynae]